MRLWLPTGSAVSLIMRMNLHPGSFRGYSQVSNTKYGNFLGMSYFFSRLV